MLWCLLNEADYKHSISKGEIRPDCWVVKMVRDLHTINIFITFFKSSGLIKSKSWLILHSLPFTEYCFILSKVQSVLVKGADEIVQK